MNPDWILVAGVIIAAALFVWALKVTRTPQFKRDMARLRENRRRRIEARRRWKR
jgi:hypothetical protein